MSTPSARAATAQLVLVVALWGSAFATSKLVVQEVPPATAALLRFGGGAVVLVAMTLVVRRGAGRSTRSAPGAIRRAAAAGLLGVFAFNALYFWGLDLAPSIDGSIIVPVLSPILTTTMAIMTGRERASAGRIAGLAVGLGGAVVFFLGVPGVTGQSAGVGRLVGDLLFVGAAVCWAWYTLIGPSIMATLAPLRATTWATVAGSALLALLAVPDVGEVRWSSLSGGFWLIVVYLAVFPTAIAYVVYYRGVSVLGASDTSVFMFGVPIFGVACSALLLHESVSPAQALGGVVMLSGAVLVWLTGRRAAQNRRNSALSVPRSDS